MANQSLRIMQEPKSWQLDLHSRTDTPGISNIHYIVQGLSWHRCNCYIATSKMWCLFLLESFSLSFRKSICLHSIAHAYFHLFWDRVLLCCSGWSWTHGLKWPFSLSLLSRWNYAHIPPTLCEYPSSSGWSATGPRGWREQKRGTVQMVEDMTETALWSMTSLRQLNCIPKYRKYIELGSLGTSPNLHLM